MHKKLASDLTSLAHSILQMKNKKDVLALKEKAYEVYEKLALLAYVEEYINTTPNAEETKEELIEKIEQSSITIEEGIKPTSVEVEKEVKQEVEIVEESILEVESETEMVVEVVEELTEEIVKEEIINHEFVEEIKEEKLIVEEIIEQPFDELENLLFSEDPPIESPDVKKIEDHTQPTLEDELQDTLPVDVMADLFQKAEPQKTVNDVLQNTIKIDLNDRIAFVNHLFNSDQADFNRVVSQLNTFKTEKEAKDFINKMVKPDYDWSEKEEYETRLFEIIERRFA